VQEVVKKSLKMPASVRLLQKKAQQMLNNTAVYHRVAASFT
jgi:hypothetical protein